MQELRAVKQIDGECGPKHRDKLREAAFSVLIEPPSAGGGSHQLHLRAPHDYSISTASIIHPWIKLDEGIISSEVKACQ